MDFSKLAKVLALAASDNEAEAMHALRTARRLLETENSDFVELARHLAEGAHAAAGVDREVLEDAIFDLRNEIRHLRSENERLRQGFAPTQPEPAPVAIMDNAQAEATAIRLRAEMAELRDCLDAEQAEVQRLKAQEATFHQTFQEAMVEAGKLGAKLGEAEARRQRLEVENRRLTHANHALMVEMDELKAQQARFAAQLVAHEVRQDLAGTKPKPVSPRGRGKDGASQYALL